MMDQSEGTARLGAADKRSTSRVIVGVDGTAANWSAVSWAVAEARRDGRLLLLVAAEPDTPATPTTHRDDPEQEASEGVTRDLLEDLRRRLARQADVSIRVATGDPGRALVLAADDDDLLVVGKRRGYPWSHAVLGSTALAVAGRRTGPVVVVPEVWSVREHLAQHIVVGVDGARDGRVLDLAFDRAQTLGVGLVVVHAWSVPVPPRGAAAGEIQRSSVDVAHDLVDFLAPWERKYPDVNVSAESYPLTPMVSLLGAATDAQLLVVGRHPEASHPDSGGLTIGGLTRNLLHHTPCPVLIVPRSADTSSEPGS